MTMPQITITTRSGKKLTYDSAPLPDVNLTREMRSKLSGTISIMERLLRKIEEQIKK